jgi:hypothetical protein
VYLDGTLVPSLTRPVGAWGVAARVVPYWSLTAARDTDAAGNATCRRDLATAWRRSARALAGTVPTALFALTGLVSGSDPTAPAPPGVAFLVLGRLAVQPACSLEAHPRIVEDGGHPVVARRLGVSSRGPEKLQAGAPQGFDPVAREPIARMEHRDQHRPDEPRVPRAGRVPAFQRWF